MPVDGTWWVRARLSWKSPGDSSNTNSMDGAWSRTWTSADVDARQSTFRGPCCSFFCSYSCARPRQPGPYVPIGWQNSWDILRCYTFIMAASTHGGANFTSRTVFFKTDWLDGCLLGQSVGCFLNDDVSTNQRRTGPQVKSQQGPRLW